jgi:beta-galactosidase
MKQTTLAMIIMLLLSGTLVRAQRIVETIDDNWQFYPAYDVQRKPLSTQVNLPHSWNLKDVFHGMNYNRSSYVYERNLVKGARMKGKRVFLKFDAVCSHADIAINQQWIGQHKGGYTAFCFEITNLLKDGNNKITVVASNSYRTDIAPLAGDFNIYGGITRPVYLIITSQDCISPMDHGSDGVYIHQNNISAQSAQLSIETILSRKDSLANEDLKISIFDKAGKQVASTEQKVISNDIKTPITLSHPILWNGRKNPYLYHVRAELLENGKIIDSQQVETGLRSFFVNTTRGFFLNGKHLDLHGICRHEEGYQTGNLYNENAIEKDAQLIEDLGATAVRLVHYPHSRYDVEQYDKRGIVVWYELPMAGPGGYNSPGYVSNPDFETSVMNNLEEMIKQNYNSPSICFWSLFNELSHKYDSPDSFLKRLNTKAKKLDPQRLTTMALCYDQTQFQGISDVLAWNKYFGWYNGKGGIGEFLDQAIADDKGQSVGLSEYGAAASIYQHSFDKKVGQHIHYEEYQAKVHEDNWKDLAVRPQIWCKFVWQFADNPSSIRDEGDKKGINDKGLVTYDRKTCKDAYYFYQANWSSKPMLYITSRRYILRTDSVTDIKVYTNLKYVTLYLNQKKISTIKPDDIHRAIFYHVQLQKGTNFIEVRSAKLRDSCTWILNAKAKADSVKTSDNEKPDGAV